jgi:hypothetical protein
VRTWPDSIKENPLPPADAANRDGQPYGTIQLACLAPDTARTRPIARIDRGDNFHGSLAEDYYLVLDDAFDPQNFVLWLGDSGSQDDDDQSRLYPVAYCLHECVSSRKEAAVVLLYAWLRACVGAWEGHYEEDHESEGGDLLDDETVSEILSSAVIGRPHGTIEERKR